MIMYWFFKILFPFVRLLLSVCLISALQARQLDYSKDEEADQAEEPGQDPVSHTDSISIRVWRQFSDVSPGQPGQLIHRLGHQLARWHALTHEEQQWVWKNHTHTRLHSYSFNHHWRNFF